MSYSISVQHTYESIELALFNNTSHLETISAPKTAASAQIIPIINDLLEGRGLTYTDLAFVGVNQGPGPFTTLRVVISTVNGLGFAVPQVPLVAVNGLEAFLLEHHEAEYPTVALLNAFNNDVYAGIITNDILAITCGPLEKILADIQQTIPDVRKIKFIGNAVSMYYKRVVEVFGSKAYIPAELPATCSVEQIGKIAYQDWQKNKNLTHTITPLYLKEQAFKKWEP